MIPPLTGRMRAAPEGVGSTSRGLTVTLSGRRTAVDQPTRTTEQWKPVVGYEGLYEVSDIGRMKRVGRGPGAQSGRILSPEQSPHGYFRVVLYRNGARRKMFVHRLVLEAFVGPCPPGMECCHGNDVPTDNRLANLRWDTKSANIRDEVRNGNHNMSRRTHCKHGHAYTPENTGYTTDGARTCMTCRRAWKKEELRRLREAHRRSKESQTRKAA